MGTWGTGISSNDTFADVYDEFFELYNDGREPDEISRKLIKENWEMIEVPEDSHDFWFALALAQWECKKLEKGVFEKVSKIIESGKDIELWIQQGAKEKDIRKRENVLKRFLEKLSVEKSKPRVRKKKKIVYPPFSKGSCITFKFASGNYGGAVILEALPDKGFEHSLIALTRIDSTTPPETKDFRRSDIITLNHGHLEGKPGIYWPIPPFADDDKDLFQKSGEIEVARTFHPVSSGYGFCGKWKSGIIDTLEKQFELEKSLGVAKKNLKVSNFLNTPWWRFW